MIEQEKTIIMFRILNKFSSINESVDCKSIIDALILACKLSEGSAKVGALFAFHKYLSENYPKDTVDKIFLRLEEHKRIPKYDLSTYEGFIEAFVAEMVSGAAFGGALSGAGTNADVNATGLAGIDKPLNKKKIVKRPL